jgi:hypothetical protein
VAAGLFFGLATLALVLASLGRVPPVAALANVPSTWTVQTVDAPRAGRGAAMVLDSQDRPHVSYFEESSVALQYAVLSGTTWITQVVDASADVVGESSLRLDSTGRPHIAYFDILSDARRIGYATLVGSVWVTTTVEPASPDGYSRPALALDALDRPHLAYVRNSNLTLMHAYLSGTTWTKEIAAPAGVGVPVVDLPDAYPSLVISGQFPHIAYEFTKPDPISAAIPVYQLHYVALSGTQWITAIVDDLADAPYVALAFDPLGRPTIAYVDYSQDVSYDQLRYASLSGTSWISEAIEPIEAGEYVSLVFDPDGIPHVGYVQGFDARYAYKAGAAWLSQRVTTSRTVIGFASLGIDSAGDPHMAYYAQPLLSSERALEYAFVRTRRLYLPLVLKNG